MTVFISARSFHHLLRFTYAISLRVQDGERVDLPVGPLLGFSVGPPLSAADTAPLMRQCVPFLEVADCVVCGCRAPPLGEGAAGGPAVRRSR